MSIYIIAHIIHIMCECGRVRKMKDRCPVCGEINYIPDSEFAQTDIVFEQCKSCGKTVEFVYIDEEDVEAACSDLADKISKCFTAEWLQGSAHCEKCNFRLFCEEVSELIRG
jgi:rRNA maturation protein Nop10